MKELTFLRVINTMSKSALRQLKPLIYRLKNGTNPAIGEINTSPIPCSMKTS
ncbi:hypothetical protein [Legionella fallonii]|uniref:Uncharacterized protein n=1 Tax=Legionella fallonii LLAP-10 TaxID=1212491 RepID=A0A098G5L7_9GAMM|nr:hypothetical protein [Legionella fallonii]CEG57793.1 protein of unknown function [Legionella fallonii LLAP-10]